MSGERYTLDANVLVYAIDVAAGEKHALAVRLLTAALLRRAPFTVQTLGETYNAVARRRPHLAHAARALLRDLAAMTAVVSAESGDFLEALRLREQRQVQFWDAMLWATARRHGCSTILTEDLHDRPVSGGVRYLNPFEEPADPDLPSFL